MLEGLTQYAELVGIVVLILINVGRKIGKAEAPGDEMNGCEKRLRTIEERMAAFEVAGVSREKRLDNIGQKMSDIADEQQRWIGQAMDRYVSRRECDREHGREHGRP
jgi:tetrahydromethanopterin S-methyltransferase subunit G